MFDTKRKEDVHYLHIEEKRSILKNKSGLKTPIQSATHNIAQNYGQYLIAPLQPQSKAHSALELIQQDPYLNKTNLNGLFIFAKQWLFKASLCHT